MTAPSTGGFTTIAKTAAGMQATMRDRTEARLEMDGLKLERISGDWIEFQPRRPAVGVISWGLVLPPFVLGLLVAGPLVLAPLLS